MSRADTALAPAVLQVHRAVTAVDTLQDLHAEVLRSGGGGPATAFRDLSDGICAVVGQLLAMGPGAGLAVLDVARNAAERRGLEGLESVLLTAFLSAARSGPTASTAAAAAYAATPDLFDRLAGGARRVPLGDPASASIGSVSLPELAMAMGSAGGSVADLARRLRSLVTLGGSADDDPTLPPVAHACADAYAAVVVAGRYVEADAVDEAAAAALGTAMDVDPARWRRPATHLVMGAAVALGLRLTGAVAEPPAEAVGDVPAGLAPRARRGSSSADSPGAAAGQPVPAAVTTDVTSWVVSQGRTAELDPPRALRPADAAVAGPERRWVEVTPRAVRRREMVVPTGVVYQPDVLTGELVDIYGNPAPAPSLVEAALAEASRLGVDANTMSVADFADLLTGHARGMTP